MLRRQGRRHVRSPGSAGSKQYFADMPATRPCPGPCLDTSGLQLRLTTAILPAVSIHADLNQSMVKASSTPACPDRVQDALNVAGCLGASRGRRFTPIRRKVLELLLRHERSLKAYELLDEIRIVQPNATPPTVYRALDFLLEEGLVHRVDTLNTFI